MNLEENYSKIDKLSQKIKDAQLINNSFFILGAGNFGKNALKYVKNQSNSPYILVIDKNIDVSSKNLEGFINILNVHEVLYSTAHKKFFFQRDIEIIAEILQLIFPENLIPAVPIHAVAYIVQCLFNRLQLEKKLQINIEEIQWNEIVQKIPQEVLFKEDPTNGIILLSWAKIDEICPDFCVGPADYCPHHHRKKTKTITQISQDIKIPNLHVYTIESHQVKAGLGFIKGEELRKLILNFLDDVKKAIGLSHKSVFLIATTCNCHGVMNTFSV